jgi:hypothetical protein
MLNKLFNKKKGSYYDTEHFKNKVRISELEEQVKIKQQRDTINKLKSKLNNGKSNNGFGNLLAGLNDGFNSMNKLSSQPNRKQKVKDYREFM